MDKETGMKRTRFTEEQKAFALRQADSGVPIGEILRKLGISEATFDRRFQAHSTNAHKVFFTNLPTADAPPRVSHRHYSRGSKILRTTRCVNVE